MNLYKVVKQVLMDRHEDKYNTWEFVADDKLSTATWPELISWAMWYKWYRAYRKWRYGENYFSPREIKEAKHMMFIERQINLNEDKPNEHGR